MHSVGAFSFASASPLTLAWQRSQASWSAWSQRRHERAVMQALRGLSDSTLQDIGLADRVVKPPQPMTMIEFERGLW